MAIPTHYDITFSCGHTEERDLSDCPAGRRNGFASWLRKQVCSDCFKKESAEEFKKEKLEEAYANQDRLELPPLEGTEKQVPWATSVRDQHLMGAFEEYVRGEDATLSEEEFENEYLVPARAIVHSRWWIDNKDIETEDLKECLDTALEDEEVITSENPY